MTCSTRVVAVDAASQKTPVVAVSSSGVVATCPEQPAAATDAAESASAGTGATVQRLRHGDAESWGGQVANQALGDAAP